MRAFIAVDLIPPVRKQLAEAQARLKRRCPPLKWVEPANLHITIKFLGELDPRITPDVQAALAQAAAECRPFDIVVEGWGTFGASGPVKVLWVGLHDAGGGLAALARCCDDLLEPLGLPREQRAFSAHLTLARNNDFRGSGKIREALAAEPPFRAGTQQVDELTFYQSTLTPRGPIYQALSRHDFGGA